MTGIEGLLAGRVLGGRYLIEEVIGRGGMGAVYRARDERLGREVALKVITLSGAGDPATRDRLRARFHREARAAAGLPHHPNVVPVYDYGTDDALGLDYIVMELLRGHDLATRLARSGPPPLPAALKVLHQAARGLAVGHRARMIHRDVKPGNIFLAQAGHDEIQVRVVDFGIAKLADDEDTNNQLTQDGRAPHSPAYASPEQLRGLSNLTPASDVFGLGAVGFQLVTGERPFSDSDRNRMSLGMPVPPPPLRARNPAVPAAVEEVIQKALAFDPEDRFADAGAMAAALERVLRELPDTPLEPYEPAVGLPLLSDDATVAEPGADRTQFMEDDRTLLDPAVGRPPPAAAPPPPPRSSPEPAAEPRRSRVGLVVWSLVLLALGGVVAWAVLLQDGGGSLADAPLPEPDTVAVVQDTVPVDTAPLQPELDAVVLNQEGLRLYRTGQFDLALEQFRQAVDLDPNNASYRRNLALALFETGQAPAAAEQLRQVLQLDPTQVLAYANLAQAQLAQADTAAAIESLERFVRQVPDGRPRQIAERQLRDLKAARAGLLGVPLDTTQPALPPVPADTTGRPAGAAR